MAKRTTPAAPTASRRPPLREAQREFTRRLLIEVALEVFDRTGYANTTVDDIVTAANATRATFYQYFRSKRDVIDAVMEEMNAEGSVIFRDAFQERPTRAAVRQWLEEVVDFYERNRPGIKAAIDASGEHGELRGIVAGMHQGFIHSLAERMPADARHSPELRATLLEAQRERLMQWWLVDGWPLDREETIAALTDVWAEALGAS